MTLDELQEKLAAYEQQFEAAKAQLYRFDGIVAFIRAEIQAIKKAEGADGKPS